MFYGGVALIPSVYLLWVFSQGETSEEPFVTRLLHQFDSWQEDYNRRNYMNAMLSKQAADDKILFSNSGIHPVRRRVPTLNIEYDFLLGINEFLSDMIFVLQELKHILTTQCSAWLGLYQSVEARCSSGEGKCGLFERIDGKCQ